MKEKRGAIQLSTNFIVMLIISIVVFGFAIYMMTRIFSFAEEERLRLDQQTENLIDNALDSGERVFIPRERRTIYPGDTKVFGMGILNTLGTGNDKFGVLVQFNTAFDKDNNEIINIEDKMNEALLSTEGKGDVNGLFIDKRIEPNEQAKFLIGVELPDTISGTYIYNLYVAYDRDSDGMVKCEDFQDGLSGDPPDCTIANPGNLYDSQIHKLYVIVP